jgi:hypothetical protein
MIAPTQQLNRLSSAWYEGPIAEFASASADAVLGRVLDNSPHAIEPD